MKILIVLASYRAGAGDQGKYAHRLAKGLRGLGHSVTLLVSDQERSSPSGATPGIPVVVAPILAQLGTLVCLPTLGLRAGPLIAQHDAVSLHLPQWGAMGLAAWCRAAGKPLVLTYHHDLNPPKGWFNAVVGAGVGLGIRAAGLFAHRIVCHTEDFARSSRFLQSFSAKTEIIPPPAEVPEVGEGAVAAFRKMHRLDDGGPAIGTAAQLAAENGFEVLLQALPRVLEEYPNAHVLSAGQYWEVKGEEAYARRLAPLFREYESTWSFLGVLRPLQMAALYPNLDVLVVPSLNSSGSFALAQVEAMLSGTPVVASDLPGVRQAVKQSGMGKLVEVGDGDALAEAIVEVIAHRQDYVRPRDEISERWSTERTAKQYECLFERLLHD